MNFSIGFICLILVVVRNVECEPFELLDDFLAAIFYRSPEPNLRQMEILESLNNNYTIKDTIVLTRSVCSCFFNSSNAGLVEIYDNYTAEKHNVTTEDGYIVTIFRISGSPKYPPKDGKPVVFIQHGTLASSDSWVFMGEGCDLAFLLADEGYDVWIGNIRGNVYGRDHTYLTVEDDAFWNFTFHEIGMLDLPAMVDYVLNQTGQADLVYIGHSMGTSIVYILLSEKPEYNEKFRLTISLAPIAFWVDSVNLVWSFLCDIAPISTPAVKIFDITNIFPQRVSEDFGGNKSPCRRGAILQPLCAFILMAFFGKDVQEFNHDLLPYILMYNPAGISTKLLQQYQQNINTRQFRPWNYGASENEKIYGASEPPEYNVTKISAPCALFYGSTDPLAKKDNVIELARRLQNVVAIEEVPYSTFNHLDFMWATNARALVYNNVISIISKYS